MKGRPVKNLFSLCIVVCLALSTKVLASIGAVEFDSEQELARYQGLVHELRCPKCQNQNLSDSNSEIAVDLRNQVARMVGEGQSNEQIKEYMVNRYGDFVLYRPPVQSNTLVLWWGPLAMAVVGLAVFLFTVFQRRKLAAAVEGAEQHAVEDYSEEDTTHRGYDPQ